jgi:glycosyltransferase involved in cell wall biosynthesis
MVVEDKLPSYVLRILAGASVLHEAGGDKEVVMLTYDNDRYYLDRDAYNIAAAAAEILKRQILPDRGIHTPFTPNHCIFILHAAKKEVQMQMQCTPDRVRVLPLIADKGACGFYRCIQPSSALNSLPGTPLKIMPSNIFMQSIGEKVDIIITQRALLSETLLDAYHRLQNQGRILIYETDDLLSDVPDWSSAKTAHGPDEIVLQNRCVSMADALFVSTPELKKVLGYPNKTWVLPNAIDPNMWGPLKQYEGKGAHILWAGSNTHYGDLRMVVPILMNLLDKYRRKLHITFMGYIPPEFLRERHTTEGVAIREIRPPYGNSITFLPATSMEEYPALVARVEATIAIAPLLDIVFNQCKSEIKVLEMVAGLGLPIVASNVAPYARAIRHNQTGLLAKTPGEWQEYLSKLIESRDERWRLGKAGQEDMLRRYSLSQTVETYERAYLEVAAKHGIGRPVADAAVKARLEFLDSERGQ